MKKKLHLLWCLLLVSALNAQQNWTWLTGSGSIAYVNPNYGSQGVAANSNDPGTREQAYLAVDNSGNVWLFGGYKSAGPAADLWRYTPSNGLWTYMGGSTGNNVYGVYGTQGVGSTSNYPGSRYSGSMIADDNGNLWLFGGYGYTSNNSYIYLNDVWKYNIASGQWTWVKGSNTGVQYGVYGTTGSAASTNYPGSRQFIQVTKDPNGNIWFFGGNGYAASSTGYLGDLWMFNPNTTNFTYYGGTNTSNQIGSAGAIGAGSTGYKPGTRYGGGIAADGSGNIWIYSGYGYSSNSSGYTNDLWKFTPSSGVWTYVSGSVTAVNIYGTYGTQGTASSSNLPGGREFARLTCDNVGNIWMMGTGYGYTSNNNGYMNDLWRYNITSGQWTWMKGSNTGNQYGVFGTLGVGGANNTPGCKYGPAYCNDGSGNIYAYGGYGYGSTTTGQMGDFWKFNVCDAPNTPSILNNTTSLVFCSGGTTTLSASTNSGVIAWFNSATSTTVLASGNSLTTTPLTSVGTTSIYTYFAAGSVACGFSPVRASVNITVNPTPTVSVNSGTACQGAPYILYPSGASTYSYINGGQVVYPNANASYTVVGYSAAGCANTVAAVASVTVAPAPVITVSNGSVCLGNSYTINPSGASTYTYSSGSAVVTPTASAFYSVTGTSSVGCVSQLPSLFSIQVYNSPSVTVAGGTVCQGSAFVITPSGASTYSYSSGSAAVSPTTTTTYSVIGFGPNGCPSLPAPVPVTVTPAALISASGGTVCNGTSFTLSPSGASNYSYTGGNAVITPTSTSSYTITGVANSCNAVPAVVTVSVFSGPNISVANGTICSGESFTLSPSGASSFTFANGGPVVTPTSTSVYAITSSSNGCNSQTNATVIVNAIPVLSVSGGSICIGESFSITPTGANTYTFSSGNAVVSPTANTSYTISGESATGCDASDVVINIVVNALPVLNPVASATTLCAGESSSITVGTAVMYVWNNSNANTPAVTSNSVYVVSPTLPTTYSVTGTSADGCVATSTIAIKVQACTGLSELSDVNVSVFPNPNNGNFIVQLYSPSTISVTNQLGQVVYRLDGVAGDNSINIESLASGLYFVTINNGHITHNIKVIKK
jgi:hypothetical protein